MITEWGKYAVLPSAFTCIEIQYSMKRLINFCLMQHAFLKQHVNKKILKLPTAKWQKKGTIIQKRQSESSSIGTAAAWTLASENLPTHCNRPEEWSAGIAPFHMQRYIKCPCFQFDAFPYFCCKSVVIFEFTVIQTGIIGPIQYSTHTHRLITLQI